MTMRAIPILMLLTLTALAQEAAEPAKPEDLRKRIQELRSKSEAARKEAMEALKRARIEELLPLIEEALNDLDVTCTEYGDYITLGVLSGDEEIMRGSQDGTDYTLKSLGEGRYELEATKSQDGKVIEKTKDQGTLKELQEKYAFLKGGAFAIQLPATPERFRMRGRIACVAAAPSAITFTPAAVWPDSTKVGVVVNAPTEDLRFHLQLPEGAGLIVQQVMPGSRAEKLGIRRMDILLRLDGELIDSAVQLKKLHEKKGTLEIVRRAEAKKIDLAAAEEPRIEVPVEAPPTDR
jgi:hypothetical protein